MDGVLKDEKQIKRLDHTMRVGIRKLPFIARLAMAPAATLQIVSSSKFLRSISNEVRPPASTIFS